MNPKRWGQRFQNYEKAFFQLEKALAIPNPSETERAGLIQFFELAFELAWKTLKDYLDLEGFQTKSPRETLKQAYQSNLIKDGHDWIIALDDRNLTTHTYDEATAQKVADLIRTKYFPLLRDFYTHFKQK